MNTQTTVALAALLSLSSVGATFAALPLAPIALRTPFDQSLSPLNTPRAPAQTLLGVVVAIDHQQGQLSLDTNIGRIVTGATPKTLQGLQVGDRVEIVMVDEDPRQNLLQDSIKT